MTERSREEPPPQRRGEPRFPKHFVIRYRLLTGGNWHISTLRDMSQTGARFFCEDVFPPQTLLMVELGLPVFDPPRQFPVRIIWNRAKAGNIGMAEHGVAFEGDARIVDLIASALKRSQKGHGHDD